MSAKHVFALSWVLVALLVLAGCGGAVAAQGEPEETVPVVAQADTVVVAEAAIEPARWADLHFDVPGEVTEVLVAPGDLVTGGEPLLRLDTAELALSLQSAQQDVVAQRAALDRLLQGTSQAVVARAAKGNADQMAQAEVALQVKELQLEKARSEDPTEQVAAAQAQVRQLELQIAQARAQDAGPDVTAARVELERAQIALSETQDEYKKALDRPWEPQGVRDGWAKELKQAELTYTLAQANLDRARNAQRAHALSLDVMVAQLDEAKEQLARATAAQRSYALSLDMLSADVEAARLSLHALRSWENPYLDEATAQEIAQAEARLRQSEIAVARLELQMRDAELRAPFAGTVADVAVEVGDGVNPSEAVVVLGTQDQLYARTVDLTELDVARVAVGQDAQVSVDALPDSTLSGVVHEIALRAGDYRGDVVYGVTIELQDTAAAAALRWGMTAMVKIDVE